MKTLTLILVVIVTTSYGQNLIPYLKNNQYGFCDKNGNILIQPEYDEVDWFDKYGFADVRRGSKWSKIDQKGKLMFPFNFDVPIKFKPVYNAPNYGKRGYYSQYDTLKNLMRITIPNNTLQYINLKTNEKTAVYDIHRKSYGAVGIRPRITPTFHFGYSIGKINEKEFELIDINGKVLLSSENRPKIWSQNVVTYKSGKENVVFHPQTGKKSKIPFKSIHNLVNDQYFVVSNEENQDNYYIHYKSKYKKGLSDFEGNLVIDTIHKNLNWYERKHLIAINTSACLINFDGTPLNNKFYESIYPDNSRFYKAKLKNGKYVLLNIEGEKAISKEFANIEFRQNENYYSYQIDNIAGILDSNLNEVIQYPAESIIDPQESRNFLFKKDGKYGVLSPKKKVLLNPIYDRCSFGRNGYIRLKIDNKHGLADSTGKILFEPDYDDLIVTESNNEIFFKPKKGQFYACFDQDLNQLAGFISKNYNVYSNPVRWDRGHGKVQFSDRYGNPIGYPAKEYDHGFVGADLSYLIILRNDEYSNALRLDGTFIKSDNENVQVVTGNIGKGLLGIEKDSFQAVINHKEQIIIPWSKQIIFKITNDLIITKRAKKYFFFNHEGKLLYEEGFDYIDDYAINNLRRVTRLIPDKTYQYITDACLYGRSDTLTKNHKLVGYMNPKGEMVVPIKYNYSHRFFDLYAFVGEGFTDGEKNAYLVDTLGNIVLKTNYDDLYPVNHTDFSNHYQAKINGKYGIINKNGKVIIPAIHKSATSFRDTTLFRIRDEYDNWHIYNRQNEKIYSLKPQNTDLNKEKIQKRYYEYPKGVNDKTFVYELDKTIVIDNNGEVILRINSQDIRVIQLEKSDLELIEVNGSEKTPEPIFYINPKTWQEYRFKEE